MATQTGSIYISRSTIDVVEISPANVGFSTIASTKKLSLDDSSNDEQPEMAAETGNTYIYETVTDRTKTPTANQFQFLFLCSHSKSRVCDHVELEKKCRQMFATDRQTDKQI